MLEEILQNTVKLMFAEFKALNINIVNNVVHLPIISGDPDQLQQVFFNILKNSCEAISDSGTIIIDGASDDNTVNLTFTDNGNGISYEVFDKIFTPYFSTKNSGSGLGMLIVKRILGEHKATIDIASTKNIGTKITITFPRKDRKKPMLETDMSLPKALETHDN